jgi:hypothetical protein
MLFQIVLLFAERNLLRLWLFFVLRFFDLQQLMQFFAFANANWFAIAVVNAVCF